MPRPSDLSREDALIGWLRRRLATLGGADLLGDDAAFLPAANGRRAWAVTTDHQIEGVHFPSGLDPAWVARRLLAVNASDLAAVGAVPRYAFLALAAPPDYPFRRFLGALAAAAARLGVVLAGGDLARHATASFVLTLLGQRHPGGRWVRRDAARPGDRLWLGGTVGESAAGCLLLDRGATVIAGRPRPPAGFDPTLRRPAAAAVRRHLAPRPQLALGQWLAGRRRAAAIDISDGLALDLGRLATASGAGARLEEARLPMSHLLPRLAAALGRRAADLALYGGEDYVLLFALPERLAPPAPLACHPVGVITAKPDLVLATGQGEEPLLPRGFDHLAAGAGHSIQV